MKKLFIIIVMAIIAAPCAFAQEEDYLAFAGKIGFAKAQETTNPQSEIKSTFAKHLKYSNELNYDGLYSLYAPTYVNADGFNRDVYFKLIKKTWESYPQIHYTMNLKNIKVTGNTAVVEIAETAEGLVSATNDTLSQQGLLQSFADCVYYLEKFGNDWVIISDTVNDEKTYLKFGDARLADIELYTPNQVPANTVYTASLKIVPPKDRLVIASIGSEKITYPQEAAEEVFRKLPEDGTLERVFKSNKDNINEYSVASIGITKAEIKNGTEIKVYITGLGFAMSRVNVIPTNNFIKADEDTKNVKNEKKSK